MPPCFGEAQELRFALSGAPGTVVHIENINMPGAGVHLERPDLGARWRFDTKRGGSAGFIDDTRFPVQIKVTTSGSKNSAGEPSVTSVAILSTKSFDATRDIQRDTLHYGGIPVLLRHQMSESPEKKEVEKAECVERDLDGDKRLDLVCQFATPAKNAVSSQASKQISTRKTRLEGITPYGWMIEGQED